jgi:hypothetical protein
MHNLLTVGARLGIVGLGLSFMLATSSAAFAQVAPGAGLATPADCIAAAPADPGTILAQYATRPYRNTDLPAYIWESLLRAAGAYPDDDPADVTAAFIDEATSSIRPT